MTTRSSSTGGRKQPTPPSMTQAQITQLLADVAKLASRAAAPPSPPVLDPEAARQSEAALGYRLVSTLLGRGNTKDPNDPFTSALATASPHGTSLKNFVVTKRNGDKFPAGSRVEITAIQPGLSETLDIDGKGVVRPQNITQTNINSIVIRHPNGEYVAAAAKPVR